MRYLRLVIFVFVCFFASDALGYSARVGQVHPDFTLPGIVNGEPVSLSQFRGRKVLLVHFASW